MPAKLRKDPRAAMTVTKTISLPLPIIEAVLDEAEVMRVGFSEATQLLLREGIAHRRQVARELEEQERRAVDRARKEDDDRMAKILGASQ